MRIIRVTYKTNTITGFSAFDAPPGAITIAEIDASR